MCQQNKLVVKGMVCQRCVAIVHRELSSLNIPFVSITLGQVIVKNSLQHGEVDIIQRSLQKYGFDVLLDKQVSIVNEVKAIVEEMFSSDFDLMDFKFARYISKQLHRDYDLISSSFSTCQGITIERYILNRRLEKVKEYLVNTKESLSEIAFSLGFSSVAHLCKQFKDMCGLTPTEFRKIQNRKQNSVLAAA